MLTKSIALLGSTGSIGTQTLEVCEARGYRVQVLAAHSNVALLEQQARKFRPRFVVVAHEGSYSAMKAALADTDIMVSAGSEAVCEAAAMDGVDTVVNAVVGIAGLRPTLAALEAKKKVALANKEALITGGSLVMSSAEDCGTKIFPVDSEHSAIWQCLEAGCREDVESIILTASGGPFFGRSRNELEAVTVEQALRHPNWDMGAKITVDSATLMNKGLEFIEAMWLFALAPEQIQVVVHRQSVIHSAVEYRDGSVIAQLGVPDMRGAIQYALTYPRRMPLENKRLSLADYGSLSFYRPDYEAFPCLAACIRAAELGGLAPTVANGANEEAVALFLAGRLSFNGIGDAVRSAVEQVRIDGSCTLERIEAADAAAREHVHTIL